MTLEFLTAPELRPVRHGFFTRAMGVSGGIYAGLNCGEGSGDDPASVRINRSRVADTAGLNPDALLSLHQVHSTDVVEVTKPAWDGARPKADAMVTREKAIGLGIVTADCAPVLLADKTAGVIGAAHAGWKGALGNITENTIQAMVALGASRENIVAAIGPAISQQAYEVGPEFFDRFRDENPDFTRFFINGAEGRMLFDLPSFLLYRLRESGVGSAGWINRCTYSEPRKFFSYRRATHNNEPDYGRLLSVIRL